MPLCPRPTSRVYHGPMPHLSENPLEGLRVLDGGLATELEFLGADITGPLWSAHVLEDTPDLVQAVHRAYIEAGAECIATVSYQVSRRGYREIGLPPERADRALIKAVELAVAVRDEFLPSRVLVAASLGPWGAALHNGAEYHGNYDCSFDDLVAFHRERIAVLAPTRVDLLAFETIPSLEEAEAIAEALKVWPEAKAWLSFTCRDGECVAHGEPLRQCAEFVATLPQAIAIGVNCTAPQWIPALIAQLKLAGDKPILVYPNSGETWDASARRWRGSGDPDSFADHAQRWFQAGAQMVGGCCRTRPEHIRRVAAFARNISGSPSTPPPAP